VLFHFNSDNILILRDNNDIEMTLFTDVINVCVSDLNLILNSLDFQELLGIFVVEMWLELNGIKK